MALKLSFDPSDGSPVWADCYHRIESADLRGSQAVVVVVRYFDEAAKDAGKPGRYQEDFAFPYDKTGENVHSQGYAWLKANDLQGATDV